MTVMVAFALNTEPLLQTASHARGQDRSCNRSSLRRTNSASRANLRSATYVGCVRLGTCSRDPIGYEGSEWNLFQYVGSMPTRFVDPTGLWENYYPRGPGRFPDRPRPKKPPLPPRTPPPPTFGQCFWDEYSNCSKSGCSAECDWLFISLSGGCAVGCYWVGPGFGHCMTMCQLEALGITAGCKLSCARCKRD